MTRPAFEVSASFAVPPGRVLCLIGPNGAGKSTLLSALAGLVRPARARVDLDGRTLDDTGAEPPRHVPVPERRIGTVFQGYRLFPHLSAVENVAFGLRARGRPRQEARAAAHRELARVGLAEFADRRPGELSGGQAQRVAVARALASEPRLLLLDEPLAALDAESRGQVRAALGSVLREFGGATVLVTHDPVDAVALADDLIVLERGAVVQTGAPTEVLLDPFTSYAASLTGAAFWVPEETGDGAGGAGSAGLSGSAGSAGLSGSAGSAGLSGLPGSAGSAGLPGGAGGAVARIADGLVVRSSSPRAATGPSRVVVPIDAVTFAPAEAEGAIAVRVVRVEQRLSRLAVTVATERGGREVTVEAPLASVGGQGLEPGRPAHVVIDPDRVVIR